MSNSFVLSESELRHLLHIGATTAINKCYGSQKPDYHGSIALSQEIGLKEVNRIMGLDKQKKSD